MAPTLQGEWIKELTQHSSGRRQPLLSFGGELKPNYSIDKDLYVFDFNTHTWSISPANEDVSNVKALDTRMVAVGTKLYLFGGHDENKQFDDFYSYDTAKKQWKFLTNLDEAGGPEARTNHSMASDENHVYVFGGVNKDGTNKTPVWFRTIETYNIADGKWDNLADPGENFEKRGGAGFPVVQGKIKVVYGFATSIDPNGKNDYESDAVQCYDPASKKWIQVETKGDKPSATSVIAHAVVEKYILIFGGETWPNPKVHLGPETLSNEGFILDTETLVRPRARGWTIYTTATVYDKNGLLMHGGKLPTNSQRIKVCLVK